MMEVSVAAKLQVAVYSDWVACPSRGAGVTYALVMIASEVIRDSAGTYYQR